MAMRWSRRGKEIAEGEFAVVLPMVDFWRSKNRCEFTFLLVFCRNGGGGGYKRIAAGAAFCN